MPEEREREREWDEAQWWRGLQKKHKLKKQKDGHVYDSTRF